MYARINYRTPLKKVPQSGDDAVLAKHLTTVKPLPKINKTLPFPPFPPRPPSPLLSSLLLHAGEIETWSLPHRKVREMTVFGNSGAVFLAGKQVFPVDYQAEVSQKLVDASHNNDLKQALQCLEDPFVDVNFIGTVSLKSKKTEVLLHDESANEVHVEYEEFKTDVTALFLAAHAGNLTLVRKLLVINSLPLPHFFSWY